MSSSRKAHDLQRTSAVIDHGHRSIASAARPTQPNIASAWLLAFSIVGATGLVHADASHAQLLATVDATQWPRGQSPLSADPKLEERLRELLARMSLEEKVGQVIQADIGSITPKDLARYPLGSILAGGNSAPNGKQYATAQEWLELADAYHDAAANRGGVAIPLLFGIDAVHGHNNVIGATLYPHNIGLGATNDPALVGRIAEATARELRVTGAEWTFAPTLTVPRDDRWGRTYEGFSESPAHVARYAAAVVEGLQGKAGTPGFLDDTRVLSAAKHFVGDGGTADGRDQGDTRIDEAGLRDIHAAGYPPAIAAGVQTVMASFSSWNGVKLHGHHGLLTDVLRGRMGFDGFVVGDWNGHRQVPGCSSTDCVASLEAGVDMFMAPDSWRELFDNTLAAAREGRLSSERLDEAVARILRVKLRMGLLDAPKPSARTLGGRFELVGAPAHRALAREAVRGSLVLLKNNEGVLPIDPRSRIGVAGDGADSVAKQSGGWTLNWQGTGTSPSDFPGATSIWEGLRTQIEAAGGQAELSENGRFKQRPDVAIVVFGENPYAEFQGDIDSLAYQPDHARDLELLQKLRAQGIKVVAVFLSGRPLWVNRELNASDAFIAAWLPGSEGGGIADVLLGDAEGGVQYDFKGRLSFSWPARPDQYTLNEGDPDYSPLLAYGDGLSYAQPREIGELPEAFVLGGVSRKDQWFARGALAPGVRFELIDEAGTTSIEGNGTGLSADGHLQLRAVDRNAQEDARLVSWSGPAQFALALATPIDIERETNGDVQALVIELSAEHVPEAPLKIGMGCGPDCAGELDAAPTLRASEGRWVRLGLPLKCLRSAGLDVSRVTQALRVQAEAGTRIRVARIELGTDAEQLLECTP